MTSQVAILLEIFIGGAWECFHSISRPRKPYKQKKILILGAIGKKLANSRKEMAAILNLGPKKFSAPKLAGHPS